MDIHTTISLKHYTTMRLGGDARFMAEATTPEEIQQLCQQAGTQQLPIFILGGGSNTIVRDEGFSGLVIRNRLLGKSVVNDTPSTTTIKVNAGENWDEIVAWSVEQGLSGIEALSAIPGTTGAAPVQNIGAYGQEIADTLQSVDVYDISEDRFTTLAASDCDLRYRHSIFRGEAAGRYVITAVTMTLYKSLPKPPFYKALEDYFAAHDITTFTPQIVRDAVTAIRRDKLPDPALLPNTGSFFKNAIIEDWQLADLRKQYPDMPVYDMPDGRYKVPTGWLIERVGLKGSLIHGIRVHHKNALVLINEHATSFAQLAAARDEIIGAVRDTFRITIEQEPLEI